MTCGEYVENMLIFAQYSTHILSNQQLVTSTQFLGYLFSESDSDNPEISVNRPISNQNEFQLQPL